jgi:flagellar motor switch protein FliN
MNTNTAGAATAGEPALANTPSRQQDVNLGNLAAMLDVPLRLTVELGRAELPLAEVLALKPGSVVELDRFPGEPLDMYANGRLIARGEIIVLNDIFGFRVTDIPSATTETAAGG